MLFAIYSLDVRLTCSRRHTCVKRRLTGAKENGGGSTKDLAGKTAFITGAASGIGLGVATRLGQAGARVMLCDIRREPLDKAVADLRARGADVDAVVADVSLKPDL